MKKKILVVITALLLCLTLTNPAMAKPYESYRALKAHKTQNVDYKIVSRNRQSSTAVIAIHGGSIEKGTDQIAAAVAVRGGYDYYAFKGLASAWSVHLTSTKFDEPIARALVAKSTQTLAIHGCGRTSKTVTYVGGRDKTLGKEVKASLKEAGFKVATPPSGIGGKYRSNIVNRNRINKGVQLELSPSMRSKLMHNDALFDKYVNALVSALN